MRKQYLINHITANPDTQVNVQQLDNDQLFDIVCRVVAKSSDLVRQSQESTALSRAINGGVSVEEVATRINSAQIRLEPYLAEMMFRILAGSMVLSETQLGNVSANIITMYQRHQAIPVIVARIGDDEVAV